MKPTLLEKRLCSFKDYVVSEHLQLVGQTLKDVFLTAGIKGLDYVGSHAPTLAEWHLLVLSAGSERGWWCQALLHNGWLLQTA